MNLFRRILVPHDFSRHATRALEYAAGLAKAGGGRLIVLHAIPPFQPITAHMIAARTYLPEGEEVRAARGRLEGLVARTVRGARPRVEVRVVIDDPLQAIDEASRGADLIVMSTAGRTGLARLLIGSIAEKVVRHARVPVLTIRPRTR
ncbi:MAG TPA: universal stress protein [Candidatus Polarisedimenticolia bacterium]|nr:universal stress protein [Candidatus Polarisedimenticolia bacterium]